MQWLVRGGVDVGPVGPKQVQVLYRGTDTILGSMIPACKISYECA